MKKMILLFVFISSSFFCVVHSSGKKQRITKNEHPLDISYSLYEAKLLEENKRQELKCLSWQKENQNDKYIDGEIEKKEKEIEAAVVLVKKCKESGKATIRDTVTELKKMGFTLKQIYH